MKAISVILAVDRNHRNLELLSQFWGVRATRRARRPRWRSSTKRWRRPTVLGWRWSTSGFDRAIWERCEDCGITKSPSS